MDYNVKEDELLATF